MVQSTSANVTVVVYSQHEAARSAVRTAIGRRIASGASRDQWPQIEWIECTSYAGLKEELDGGDVDLAILDGDAQPTGGVGLARQFKNELTDCPPIVVLVAREQDRWLASWSLADGVIVKPIDPVEAAQTVAATLRTHAATIPLIR